MLYFEPTVTSRAIDLLGVNTELLLNDLLQYIGVIEVPLEFKRPITIDKDTHDLYKTACQEADSMGHYYVGDEHICLSFLRNLETSLEYEWISASLPYLSLRKIILELSENC